MPNTRKSEATYSRYANPGATREVLEKFGRNTKHHLGQNFLVNDYIIRKICELADIQEDERVLEVGPGIGTLTCALLDRAQAVCSLEADKDLEEVLGYTLTDWKDSFYLIMGDALKVSPQDVHTALSADPDLLVSNLPYQVAATIIGRTLEEFTSINRLVVMVQAEVADRICANSGTKNYGAYTAKLQLRSEVAGRFEVGPQNFMPAPHVDSAVIKLIRKKRVHPIRGQELSEGQIIATSRLIDQAFSQRRKTLRNNLRSAAYTNEQIEAACAACEISPTLRAEALTVDDFIRLAENLSVSPCA